MYEDLVYNKEVCNRIGGKFKDNFCEVKIYHGTTKENAENIIKNGFKIPEESYEWFYGKGAYFSLNPENAMKYAGDEGEILET